MFKPIKNLANIDYLLLLQDKKDFYYNEKLNKVFDMCNKKYGNNIVVDNEDTNKNNINAVAIEMKKELNAIEPDDNKVVNSLVKFLYEKKSTRKKKLLWYMFGEQLYTNILNNVEGKNICLQCGKRTDEDLIRGKCFSCRQEEIKRLGGKKLIKCVDCGKDVEVDAKDNNTSRCEVCQKLNRYTPIEMKTIKCIDCGMEFEVDSKDNTTCRCKECYIKYRRKYKAEKEKERRKRLNAN